LADDRHQQAFELYAADGSKRTYRQVADQMGVSERTVRHWAKAGKWRDRLREREIQAARQAADESFHRGQEEHQRHLKIVRVALMFLTRSIAAGNLKQLGELSGLIRLEEHLMGIAAPGEEGGVHVCNPVVILPDNGSDPDFSSFGLGLGVSPNVEPTKPVSSDSLRLEEVTSHVG